MSQMRFSFTDADGATYDKTLSDEELLTLVNALAHWVVSREGMPVRTPQEIETAESLWIDMIKTDVYMEAQNRYWHDHGSSYREGPGAEETDI